MEHSRATALAAALAAAMLVGPAACRRANSNSSAGNAAGTQPTQSQQPSDSDRRITTSVEAKFYGSPALKSSDIRVRTSNGVVALDGSVPNDQTKQEAEQVASTVQGVQRVDDRLSVGNPPGSVATSGSGQNASPQPSEGTSSPPSAGAASQPSQPSGGQPSAGGTSQPPASVPPSSTGDQGGVSQLPPPPGAQQQLQDGAITVKIESDYFNDPSVKGNRIQVDTADGVVALTGNVENEQAHERAVEIARQVPGVKRVDDQLRVWSAQSPAGTSGQASPAPAMPDDQLTARIQSRFYRDDEVRPSNIDVKSSDGVVTLSGTVATPSQRDEALALAASTTGVRRVDDQVKVEAPPHSVGTVGVPSAQAGRSDDDITNTIQSRYFMNDRLKTSDIKVSTEGGVVTLSGTVASVEAKQDAEQTARETQGVVRVVDDISVAAQGR